MRTTAEHADGGDGREPTPHGVAAADQVSGPQAGLRRECECAHGASSVMRPRNAKQM